MSLLPHIATLKEHYKLILASGSPRRFEILSELGLEFSVIESDFEETMDPVERAKLRENGPDSYVSFLSRSKTQDVFSKVLASFKYLPDTDGRDLFYVIGADTIVVGADGEILEKGHTREKAKAALQKLSGKKHRVMTSVCVMVGKRTPSATGGDALEDVSKDLGFQVTETTAVQFKELSETTIDAYVATDEPLDKAGSYGIQGLGGLLVQGIEGCHRNVIGFPLSRFADELAQKLQAASGGAEEQSTGEE